MAGRQQQKDIQSKNLLSVDKKENVERGTVIEMRVVDWIVEGKHYPQLEKREFFTDRDTGELKMGKAKGFTLKDLGIVMDKWGEIMGALGSKLPEHSGAKAEAPAAAPVSTPASAPAEPEDF